MIRFFYNVYFQYMLKNHFSSYFDIGYFTTMTNARNEILHYKGKPGFNEYDPDCFSIQKIGVKIDNNNDKENIKLFVLTCEKEIDYGIEWTNFGAFSSYSAAAHELEKQKNKRLYKMAVFNIDEWIPNKYIEWQEGFNKIESL